MVHIIDDAHGEVVFRLRCDKIVEHFLDLAGDDVFAADAGPAADDDRLPVATVEGGFDVLIQRLRLGAHFFRPVQHGDFLDRLGNVTQEMRHRERPEQVHGQHADLFALGVQVVDDFLDCFTHRTHGNDQAFSIRRAMIIEQRILAAGQFGDFGHIALDDLR